MQSFSVPHSKLDSHIYYHLCLLCLWQVSSLLFVIAHLQEFLFFPLSHQKDDGRFYTLLLMTVLSWCPFTLISFPFWENSSWFINGLWDPLPNVECDRSIFYIFTCIRFQIKLVLFNLTKCFLIGACLRSMPFLDSCFLGLTWYLILRNPTSAWWSSFFLLLLLFH